jgi:hypothetical protein
MSGEHQNRKPGRDDCGAEARRYARGRALAYQVALAICVTLVGLCVAAMWWGLSEHGPSGLTFLMVALFPGLFPAAFLCLIAFGYWWDYRSEQARGILAPRFQFNLSHLLWLVLAAAILCALVVFELRIVMSE